MGAVSNFLLLYFGWELQLRGNFWQGPFSKDALFENGTKSYNFANLFFVTSHFGTLLLQKPDRSVDNETKLTGGVADGAAMTSVSGARWPKPAQSSLQERDDHQ